MGRNIFPALPGLTFPIERTVHYTSLTDQAASNRFASLALQQYPTYNYKLQYSILRDDQAPSEIRALVGLFDACAGMFDSFLYSDPVFNTVTNEPFGVGDGVTTAFQVIATFQNAGGGGGPDIIQNFDGVPTIFDNGGTAGSYILGPTGIVTFVTPPASGHALTWSGSFYQRCHFTDDELEVQQISNKWWAIQSLEFESVLL